MKKILLVLAVVAFAAAPALADVVAAWSQNAGSWVNVTVKDPLTNSHSTATGMSLFTQSNSVPKDPRVGNTFHAFCVDLRQYCDTSYHYFAFTRPEDVPTPIKTDVMEQPMGVARADRLQHFFGAFYDSLFTGTTAEQNTKRQAFQLAVWEIVYEDGPVAQYSLSGDNKGNLYVSAGATPDVINQANAWFATAGWDTGAIEYLAGLRDLRVGSYGQDFVTVVTAPVPAPGAALLGVIGLGLVGWIKRRSA